MASVGKAGVLYISFGRELGEKCKTPHLQGYIQANHNKKDRFHNKFGIYVVAQERSAEQANAYTQKDGDFYTSGEFDVTVKGTKEKKQGQRTDLAGVMSEINAGATEMQLYEGHSETVAKYPKFIERYRQLVQQKTALESLRKQFDDWSPWKWQTALIDVVSGPVDPRKIHWIWETKGNAGKSTLALWLVFHKNACLLEPSKKADMAHVWVNSLSDLVVFDCTRATEKAAIMPAYALAEKIKDGAIFSGKYASRTVVFKKPHVIFFANFKPDMTAWSADRYDVTELDQRSFQ